MATNYRAALNAKLLAMLVLALAAMAGCHDGLPLAPPAAPPPTAEAPAPGPSPTTPTPRATVQTTAPEPADGFPAPPERDFFRLACELIPGIRRGAQPCVRTEVAHSPAPLRPGHRREFNLVDLFSMEKYRNEFELRLVTPNAYWFVEEGLAVEQSALEQSAAEFENTIYPRITAAFGSEWKPGVDGDPRLYVLNAALPEVGGYYNPEDEYPQEIRPASNEIEAMYINALSLAPGTPEYGHILAHELQHAVHWNADPSEDSWVNEGLSELAVTIAGLPGASAIHFQQAGPISLTVWPASADGSSYPSYTAASSFMHYLTGHYGGRGDLRPLLSQQADGIAGVNAFLEAAGYEARFDDVFRDWAVANLLDEDSGRYSQTGLALPAPAYRTLGSEDEQESSIPQYATEYFRLTRLPPEEGTSAGVRLSFDGQDTAPLLPIEVGEGCWWSNNGDAISSTLTRPLDLRQAQRPNLTYQVWFAIEEDWDYAYLEVSENGGLTWQILETPLTSSDDPLDVAFGPGYTGATGGWRDESVPLDAWAGQEILLRFHYVTDVSANDHGLCVRNLAVSGLGSYESAAAALGQWTPDGFHWNRHNLVQQRFIVQVIYAGDENRVLPLDLDHLNRGTITLQSPPTARHAVIAVQALAPSTRLPASYTLKLEPAE